MELIVFLRFVVRHLRLLRIHSDIYEVYQHLFFPEKEYVNISYYVEMNKKESNARKETQLDSVTY
jgi:hypothetical protein